MKVVKGKIEQIAVKEPQEGKFSKWAGYGVKVGGAWHNGMCNEDKKTHEVWPVDKNYKKLKEGQEVEFLVEKNDKGYETINKKTVEILSDVTQTQTTNAPREQSIPKQPEAIHEGYILLAIDAAKNKLTYDNFLKVTMEQIIEKATVIYNKLKS
jgi:hypothetical protein